MRKIFYFLTLLLVMCSCGPARIETGHNEHSILTKFDHVRHFEYKGHKYIQFEVGPWTKQARMGIVHDPDCGCHNN